MSYKIVRHYLNGPPYKRVIARGLSLEQAKEWCHDKETSSKTCTLPHNKARTRKLGPWFDGFSEE